MCVILAKYFPKIGWAGAKNRDRNYIPKISFEVSEKNNLERMMLHDDTTGYKEGINSHGVCILSASLMVQDDEKEVSKGEQDHSPDGLKISKALLQDNAVHAAKACIAYQLTGNTIIFDKENCFLLEACRDLKGKFRFKMKKMGRDETVARTNHGIWLPWTGYQRKDDDESQTLSRISSEARMIQGQIIALKAKQPEDLVNGMCQVYINNPQLNVMRTDTERKKMRTTAQELGIPSERTLYCRPVSSHIKFDFWKLNKPYRNVWIEILSNRELWKNTKGDPPFGTLSMQHK